jgi:hypothetical protein
MTRGDDGRWMEEGRDGMVDLKGRGHEHSFSGIRTDLVHILALRSKRRAFRYEGKEVVGIMCNS